MIPFGAEAPPAVRQIIPWLALGHGIFNTLVMCCFCYQGWLGHVIRRHRLAGTRTPLPVVRRHRRFGPWLAGLGCAGFFAGLSLVVIDQGKVVAYPLHFSLGLALILTQVAAWAVSRKIKGSGAGGRSLHRLLGILILCLYPVQVFVGLGVLL
jgi:hypothetical protein